MSEQRSIWDAEAAGNDEEGAQTGAKAAPTGVSAACGAPADRDARDELLEKLARSRQPMEPTAADSGGQQDSEERQDEFSRFRRRKNDIEAAERRARELRWMAPGRSRVTHPELGSVIVPHCSNVAAVENAAEFWGVNWLEITAQTKVELCRQDEGPLIVPREFVQALRAMKRGEKNHDVHRPDRGAGDAVGHAE